MGTAPLLHPCPARHENLSVEGSVGPSPPTSPTLAAVSGEVVMGTLRCRYPSPWVPLLACHAASGWRTSSACMPSTAWQGGQGEHRALCGGLLPQGCSKDAGSAQGWRSPACPYPPCQGPVHPQGPRWAMGQGGGCRHRGNGVAEPQRQQPCRLPTPTVSQRCLFFPGPRATEPAAPSPVTLGDFNPAAPTGYSRMGVCTHLAPGACRGAGGRIHPHCRTHRAGGAGSGWVGSLPSRGTGRQRPVLAARQLPAR